MGGHSGGEIASQTAISIIKESIKTAEKKMLKEPLERQFMTQMQAV